MSLDRWEKLAGTLLAFATVVAIVIGGGFAVFEFRAHKHDRRVEQALELAREFNSPEVWQARNRLNGAMDDGFAVLERVMADAQADPARAYETFILALVDEANLSGELNLVFGFLERVVTCVEARLCDRRAANDLFGKDAQVIFRQYHPYVCRLRDNWNDSSIWAGVERQFNPESGGGSCRSRVESA